MSIIIAIVLIYLFVLFMRSGNKQSTNHPQTAVTVPDPFARVKEVEVFYCLYEKWASRKYPVWNVTRRGNMIILRTGQTNCYHLYDDWGSSFYHDFKKSIYRDSNGQVLNLAQPNIRWMGIAPIWDEDHEYVEGSEMMFEVVNV